MQQIGTSLEHSNSIDCLAVIPESEMIISGYRDNTMRVWDLTSGNCHKILTGHTGGISALAVTHDGKVAVSGSRDNTLKVWDISTGRCCSSFEGHSGIVFAVNVTADGKTIVSGSSDKTIKCWDVETGRCKATFVGHVLPVWGVAISLDGKVAVSASKDMTLKVWSLSIPDTYIEPTDSARYTNAKVVLVGESGVGKTGLALRLAENRWQLTDSTHGMKVWQLHLYEANTDDLSREIWLWDFCKIRSKLDTQSGNDWTVDPVLSGQRIRF